MSKRGIDRVYSDRLQEHSGIKRNKKACTECRQQKVRCNATIDSNDPCSRCRRMGLSCVISDPFKREHKRQRLSELEKEALDLRRRLETQTVWGNGLPPTPTTASMDHGIASLTPVLSNSSTSPPTHVVTMASPPAETFELPTSPSPAGTQARSLDGVLVQATTIDELFSLYFQDFHQHLPILEQKNSPDIVYERSLLLFWAIIAVSCRTYAKDPTLLDSLGERVLNLCLLSLRTPTVSNIKGLLLVLTWPLSKTAGNHDMAYAISGSILHMAIQIGLHIPTSSQDFSRVKVNLTEAQIVKRAELWGYCIVTYQRSCSFKGYSPLALLETYQDSEQRHTLFQRINHSLRFQLRLNGVLTRCSSALLQNGLRIMSKDQEHALEILIRVFEATLKDVEPEAVSELDKFHLYTARVTVQAFHFYKNPAKKLPSFMLTRLYTSACVVLRHIDRMDSSGIIKLSNAPFYFFYATTLASFSILRLLKASTAQYMDDNAKETFFLGVNVMKRLSSQTNDGPSRISMMLTQLWNSEKAFKDPDGSEHMALRIRTRLAMSPVFDSIWWWREEFGGEKGVYTKEEGVVPPPDDKTLVLLEDPTFNKELDFQGPALQNQHSQEMSSFLDDHLLAELGWTNSSNYPGFYTPIPAPYNADWYSPTDLTGFAI